MRSSLVLFALLVAPSAHAGGVFHGVRCGLGPDTGSAVKQLNERLQAVGGGDFATQADLAMVSTGGGVLACVVINRPDWWKPEADDVLVVECVTEVPEKLAASRFGIDLGRRNQRLQDLTLTQLPDGRVSACALNVPVQAPKPG